MFKRQKPIVGLDIGSSSIKVVQVEDTAGEHRLLDFGTVELLPEAIVDGEIMDRQLVVETIQNLFETKQVTTKAVASSVSGRAVIVKKIRMDRMAVEDAREAINWEAEQHVPYDINEVSLDFQILEGGSDPKQMEVLLVAAKREMLNSYSDLIREAGLTPMVIDVDAFAIQNVLTLNYDFGPDDVVAMVDIGSEITSVNIVRSGIPLYTQDLSLGGTNFVEAIQRTFNLSQSEAEAVIRGEDNIHIDLKQVVQEVGEELAMAIERSAMYLQTSGETEELSRVLLTGGGVRIPGLVEFLSQRHNSPVEIADPLRRIAYDPAIFGKQRPQDVAPSLAVGLGLALRKVDDR